MKKARRLDAPQLLDRRCQADIERTDGMSLPRSPGQDARANRGLNPEQLRVDLSAAVERFDHHMREAQDLGRLNKTAESLKHLGLANDAARECERLADQITALGRPAKAPAAPARASDWTFER